MDEYYDQQPQVPPPQYMKLDNSDPNFNQWFLECKEDIKTLAMYWRGWVKDEQGIWYEPPDFKKRSIMNDTGIHWCVQLMEGYLSKPFLFTNWDKEEMNFEMRQTARVIWRGLSYQHALFALSKINTYVIGKQVFAQIHSIMLASRGEGIRKYLGTTQQINEINQRTANERQGMFSGIMGMFGRNRGSG